MPKITTEDIPFLEIRKIYGKLFPGTNTHHMIPSSRNGPSSHFNLYPYRIKAHRAYHDIFWNLTVQEVWTLLGDAHDSIFNAGGHHISQWWVAQCDLEKGTAKEKQVFRQQKKERLAKSINVKIFQNCWRDCFGNDSIKTARIKMKHMMLFIVFGINMMDIGLLLDNGKLNAFIKKRPFSGQRLWASKICFGKNGHSIRSIKAKTSKIIRNSGSP